MLIAEALQEIPFIEIARFYRYLEPNCSSLVAQERYINDNLTMRYSTALSLAGLSPTERAIDHATSLDRRFKYAV